MFTLFNLLLNCSRSTKRAITLSIDCFFIFGSFWLALFISLDGIFPIKNPSYWTLFTAVLPISVLLFLRLGLYRAILRFISAKALWAIVAGTAASTVSLVLVAFFASIAIPKIMPLMFALIMLLSIGGSRLMARALITQFAGVDKKPVVVYGAGAAGRQLQTGLAAGDEYYVTAFIDDDKAKQNSVIQGVPVVHRKQLRQLIAEGKAEKILLALPSASRARRNRIINKLEHAAIKVQTIPGIKDMVEGNYSAAELVDVDIDDLLGREPVDPLPQLMALHITAKSVMVTGAGGSVGSELCRQILRYKPLKLVLFELSEFALYNIDIELSEYIQKHGIKTKIFPVMGSVQRVNRIEAVMKSFKIDTVYHAAAYQHTRLVDQNVVEGIRNNVFGTYYTAKAAMNAGLETFVLISTDKAARPTNIMAASKRLAELLLQALDKTDINKTTKFCTVRFGNVLDSAGSVVPLFRKQVEQGGPLTLPHENTTRFFMTIPEAAQLVIQCGAMGKGGDIFVLDMGESVRIKDLAEKMIRLSGLEVKDENNPDGDIELLYTGLPTGEKLNEELMMGDNVSQTFHDRILTANEAMLQWEDLTVILDALDQACHNFDHEAIRDILFSAPTGFNPSGGINDLVWVERHPTLPAKEHQSHKPKLNIIK